MDPADAAAESGDLTVRALRAAGFAALAALPLLLLASLMLSVPLAGPALIASGYLGAAFMLATDRSLQADLVCGIVLAGLLGWTFLCFATETVPAAWDVPAALLAPCFAAAPALVRIALGRGDAGRPPHRGATPCRSGDEAPPAQRRTTPLRGSACTKGGAGAPAAMSAAFMSDVGEAIEFARRSAERRAAARDIRLRPHVEAGLLAACDRQTSRRIARALLDCGIMFTPMGGYLTMSARKLPGVVLLRVRAEPHEGDVKAARNAIAQHVAGVRLLVEGAEGTLIQDAGEEMSLSVRLPLARTAHARKAQGISGAT